ncbi:MAG: hypothetical protein HF978_02150 [Desulfobacteraceae bacterium]|nr:hypothetical protein [Desulfobacteraceae bacterium]MBC2754327.1 hypothetical protein [Desulfobacteraceae bacterium]
MYNIDRHILKNGYACLGVQAEIRQKWPQGSLIVDFIENIIEPFLAWQAYYDEFQKVPPWGERSHFPDGILEYYAELLQLSESGLIKDFMTLLARKNNPKGHEFCPCQSGKRLRHCHRELIDNVRKIINWEVVGLDLKQINSFESKK